MIVDRVVDGLGGRAVLVDFQPEVDAVDGFLAGQVGGQVIIQQATAGTDNIIVQVAGAQQIVGAAGECCALYHGANRLGGNSLLGALYGGRVAAQTACAEAESASKRAVSIQPSNAVLPCEPQDKAELNRILLHALGVVRSGDTMQDALTQIAGMHGSLPLLGQAVLKSALTRQESRGAHWRSDYPQRNDAEFRKITAAYYDGQMIHISWDAVPERR